MIYNIALVKGDGIGPEIVDSAVRVLEKIGEKYGYSQWEKRDGEMAIRLCTSWATDMTKVDELIADLKALTK